LRANQNRFNIPPAAFMDKNSDPITAPVLQNSGALFFIFPPCAACC
jgi:hypothetical protein